LARACSADATCAACLTADENPRESGQRPKPADLSNIWEITMKRMALLLMLALPGWLFAQSSDEAASKPAREPLLPLRLVYIGNGKSPRAEHFAEFLKKHFATVTIADREGFKPK